MKEGSGYGSTARAENPYDVPYRPQASANARGDWVCDMTSDGAVDKFRTLEKGDLDHALTDNHLPDAPLFARDEVFDTCAIVSNAATLRNSNLGYFIGNYKEFTGPFGFP